MQFGRLFLAVVLFVGGMGTAQAGGQEKAGKNPLPTAVVDAWIKAAGFPCWMTKNGQSSIRMAASGFPRRKSNRATFLASW